MPVSSVRLTSSPREGLMMTQPGADEGHVDVFCTWMRSLSWQLWDKDFQSASPWSWQIKLIRQIAESSISREILCKITGKNISHSALSLALANRNCSSGPEKIWQVFWYKKYIYKQVRFVGSAIPHLKPLSFKWTSLRSPFSLFFFPFFFSWGTSYLNEFGTGLQAWELEVNGI